MTKKQKRILALMLGAVLLGDCAARTGTMISGLSLAYAATGSATVNATTLNVRSTPGTTGSVVKKLAYGAAVTVVSETAGSDGKTWYKIQFSSGSGTQEGYVRSDYIKFPVSYSYDSTFENYLNSQGFPESYKVSLRTLHTEHPTWVFQAQKTGLNWSDVMAAEGAVGTNLVSKSSISSWKSTEYGAYDWNTGIWTGFDGSSWVAASKDIVAYYMDPRNFLNDTYVFQFLHHAYDSNAQTREGLTSLITGTFLEKTPESTTAATQSVQETTGSGNSPVVNNSGSTGTSGSLQQGESYGPGMSTGTSGGTSSGSSSGSTGSQGVSLEGPGSTVSSTISQRKVITTALPEVEYGPGMDASSITDDNTGASNTSPVPTGQTYVDIIMKAAAQTGVNPYVLGAMILQEQGTGKSGSISGKTAGYEGYYNFFNVGAFASGSMSAITRGLWYASQSGSYGRPWNSIEKSIIGGATYYSENFLKNGQDTFYLKKFNVQGSNLYKHQYMTNVEGAAGEGAKLARAYTDAMKKQALVFKIPVFNNMPETACAKPTVNGSPNNKLSGITIDGYSLTPTFSKDTEKYDLVVDSSVSSVNIRATAIDSKATVSGAGTISLGSGTTIVKIVVKAENGDTRTYQVSIAKGNGNGSTTVVSPSTGSSAGSQSGSTVGPGGSTGTSSSGSTSGSSSGTSGPGSSTSGTQSSYPEGASGSGKLVTTSSGTTGTSGSTNPGSTGSYPEGASGSGKLVTASR
ncbi:MAG: SH3 domain-containing protein [Clostridium sp.]|nr:SH3 domain-containing protein [Clostridium sp. MCC344]MBS7000071.1 SH3 domain-containing protein [Clostridiaceae bacterium]MBT9789555.1 SH3 domain-containing protein [Clostridium sp. MCC344]MCI7128468.1 SH3 domain-containing protein [Clostridium sp.]